MTNTSDSPKTPILDFNNWQALSLQESVNSFMKNRDGDNESTSKSFSRLAIYKRDVSPLDIYCYLKARFGEPNGYLMIAKNPNDSANLIHWHYHIMCKKHEIHFYGKTHHVEILSQHKDEITDYDLITFPIILKQEYAKWGREKSIILKQTEKWRLFVNPHQRIVSVVNKLFEELMQLDEPFSLSYEEISKYANDKDDSKTSEFDKIETNIFEHLQKGLSLKFFIPVMVESFINILILLLSNNDIKRDKNKYQKIIKEHITEKVKSLPQNCIGFSKAININDIRYKEFQTLMNSRNDFLHGNTDPTKFGFCDVYFDRYVPLFKEPGNIFSHANSCSLRFIEQEQIQKDYSVAMSFCNFIIEQLDEHIRNQVNLVLKCPDPGWNVQTNRIGVLFPSMMVESVMPISGSFIDEQHTPQ